MEEYLDRLQMAVRGGVDPEQGRADRIAAAVQARVVNIVGSDVGAPLVGALRNRDVIQPRAATRAASTRRYVFIAAAVLLVGIATIWGDGWFSGTAIAPMAKTYTTVPGQRASIVLGDGSRIILAPATKIRVTGRTVELYGEAIFTVAQHDKTPFVVRALGRDTKVLGTTFAVRAYPKDTVLRVAVRDGKVSVSNAVLLAGDLARVTDSGVVLRHNMASQAFGLASGQLVFDGVPLREAIDDLNRWYNVDLRVTDQSLAAQKIEGSFSGGSPAQLAGILAPTFNARVVQRGQILTLSPRR